MTIHIEDWAYQLLSSGALHEKLYAPEVLSAESPNEAQLLTIPAEPTRSHQLRFADAKTSKKALAKAGTPAHTVALLGHFANHELLAIELMALALLKFRAMPRSLKLSIASSLKDEQRHLGLYLNRIAELKGEFGYQGLSKSFWDRLAPMQSIEQYFAGMSLCFEQANLDFASAYAAKFRLWGDDKTASLMEEILRDEILHVRLGAEVLERSSGRGGQSLFAYHKSLLDWPLSLQHAKASPLNREARLQAGLDGSYIDELCLTNFAKGGSSDLYYFNSDCEWEVALGVQYQTPPKFAVLMSDLETLMAFIAQGSDALLLRRIPSLEFRQRLKAAGLKWPELIFSTKGPAEAIRQLPQDRPWHSFRPWGLNAQTKSLENLLSRCLTRTPAWNFPELYAKSKILAYRKALRLDLGPSADSILGSEACELKLFDSLGGVLAYVHELGAKTQRPAWIRAAYGAAGQNSLKVDGVLTKEHQSWLSKILGLWNKVSIEPWFDRLLDLSMVGEIKANGSPKLWGMTSFEVNNKGQYQGTFIGRKALDHLSAECQYYLKAKNTHLGTSIVEYWEGEVLKLAQKLSAEGYRGPFGIDAFVFRDPLSQELKFRPLAELNPRFTMGHVAMRLRERLSPGVKGWFRILSTKELQKQSLWQNFTDWDQYWHQRYPLELDRKGLWQEGYLALSDYKLAQSQLAYVQIGKMSSLSLKLGL